MTIILLCKQNGWPLRIFSLHNWVTFFHWILFSILNYKWHWSWNIIKLLDRNFATSNGPWNRMLIFVMMDVNDDIFRQFAGNQMYYEGCWKNLTNSTGQQYPLTTRRMIHVVTRNIGVGCSLILGTIQQIIRLHPVHKTAWIRR